MTKITEMAGGVGPLLIFTRPCGKVMRKIENAALDRLSVTEFKEAEKTPLTLVLDDIRSLHNLGSIFRSADAFRIEKLYLCGITAQPPNREIHKTALGATESVEWEYRKDAAALVRELKSSGREVRAVEQVEGAVSLERAEWSGERPLALVFGNEVKGVSEAVLAEVDGGIEIPQFGTKHSLNVSVAVGVVMWHLWQDRQKKAPEDTGAA